MSDNIRGLSARETALLTRWERRRRSHVTIGEIAREVGASKAHMAASRLVRKGVLDRIGRGLYLVRPFRALGRGWGVSALASVARLLDGVPHYVTGLAALTLHHLTEQVYTSVVDVFVPSHRRARRLGNATVVFHVAPAEAFTHGVTDVEVEGVPVRVADPERTLLDVLDYPHLVGGLSAALAVVAAALPRVDRAKIVADALTGHRRMGTLQRLGLLLERAGAPASTWRPLAERVASSRGPLSFVPGAPRRGKVHPVWRVVENDAVASAAPAPR